MINSFNPSIFFPNPKTQLPHLAYHFQGKSNPVASRVSTKIFLPTAIDFENMSTTLFFRVTNSD